MEWDRGFWIPIPSTVLDSFDAVGQLFYKIMQNQVRWKQCAYRRRKGAWDPEMCILGTQLYFLSPSGILTRRKALSRLGGFVTATLGALDMAGH